MMPRPKLFAACTVLACVHFGWPAEIGAQLPTPEMALSFDMQRDPRGWKSDYLAGDRGRLIEEFVRDGESVHGWTELLAHEVILTNQPLEAFVSAWRNVMMETAKDLKSKQIQNGDGSVTIVYTTTLFKEMAIRRFLQAPDGIYVLAYHVRPRSMHKPTLAVWWEIVQEAHLVENPLKRDRDVRSDDSSLLPPSPSARLN